MSLSLAVTRFRGAALLCLFLALGVVSYWPSFFGERIWDDHFLVGFNPFYRSPALAWETYQHWLYPFSDSTYYRPTQNVSYMWDYWMSGDNLFWYHLTNVVIHAGAAFLLGFLFRRIARASLDSEQSAWSIDLLAWGTALLWLVHPIHHAGVAYVSGRADSLAALLCLGAWILCERGVETQNRSKAIGFFTLAAACGWLALCSKEIALTWFGLFAIYQLFLRSDRSRSQRIGSILAAGALVLVYAFHRSGLPRMAAVEHASAPTVAPFGERFVLMLKALGDYLSLVVAPVNLHMERMLTPNEATLANTGLWFNFHAKLILPLGILALLCAAWLCFGRSPDRKLHRFAVCWFLLGFLPISNLFPLNAQVAEHWIYMPSAALILLLVKGVLSIPIRRPALIIGLCSVLVVLTHQQSRYWVSEENFFRTTITRGGNTLRARTNLARILESKGKLGEAEAMLKEALVHHPDVSILRTHLASLLKKNGRNEEAAQVIISNAEATNRPAIPWTLEVTQIETLVASNRKAEAKEILSRALSRWPLSWPLVQRQATFYTEENEPEKALAVVTAYVSHNWWHYEAVIWLAQSLGAAGRYDEAVAWYERAALLDIHARKPFEQIVAIRCQQQRLGEALLAQADLVDRAPDSITERERLAQIYEALGFKEEAAIERMIFPRLQRKAQTQKSSTTVLSSASLPPAPPVEPAS